VPIQLDQDLQSLLESGVAIVVGTRDADLVPEAARGWGAHVLPDRSTVEVCVGLPSGRRTLRNVADNGRIAVTCVRPSDHRQVQLKGRVVLTQEATSDDLGRVDRHRAGFIEQLAGAGIARSVSPAFWSHDDPDSMMKVRFVLEEAYDQTPGPEAGRRL